MGAVKQRCVCSQLHVFYRSPPEKRPVKDMGDFAEVCVCVCVSVCVTMTNCEEDR